ncbi:chondroitin AC/alginate lyase [Mycena alexandri]|uniref:Chondroitin AC/alginate lyase n=1 Tax=Mycena alexandri TaxID=1745969 RepID=A0AAD6WPH6_9AGAR|nr:chondroitin AC/alginate lyase [Mycena alexandri]
MLISDPFPCVVFTLCTILSFSCSARATNPFTQYAVDFPDPNAIVGGKFPANLGGAEATIISWAEQMASFGPWTVTSKPVVAPSRDKHDYMSWAPYQWPNCSNVHNTTVLDLADTWKECNYYFLDGQVNPDRNSIQDFQSFFNLSDAVLYNSIAATLQNESSSIYSQNVVKFINTWFLDADTAMNPNLNYAQMNGGPGGQTGEYMGILDLRGFAKIASGILILRKTGNTDWTSDIDNQFIAWCTKYMNWLETTPTAHTAATAGNNHGTIFVNQLAGVKLIAKDTEGAVNWTQNYFTGIFLGQLAANGDQPTEASRTHPWHYRNFNIAGMITNARLLKYADPTSNPWNATAKGATIQTTVNFLRNTDPSKTGETAITAEIYPNIAAIASVYGDPTGKYAKFMNDAMFPYADDATFLWDQPLAGGDTSGGSGPDASVPKGGKSAGMRSLAVEPLWFTSFIVLALGLYLV